jgi:hypothetical protein
MNLKAASLIAGVAGALLLQAPVFAAPRACPAPGAATAKSMTWNFSKEGSRLLNDINRKAQDVRMEAAKLEVQARDPQVDWQTHATELTEVRDDINYMGEKICRLETIRGQLAPLQQSTVDKSATLTKEMANFTTDAIQFLNAHRDNLWSPSYRAYTANVYKEAKTLNHSIGRPRES